MFVAGRRATLLYAAGPADDPFELHLNVVLTEPYGRANQVIIVPICTLKHAGNDRTCVVVTGEHEFIKHESYADYSLAKEQFASALEKGVEKRHFVAKQPVTEILFRRIIAGALASNRTKPFVTSAIKSDLKRCP